MNRGKVGKTVAAVGNIVSGACLATLVALTVAHGIVTRSVTNLQIAFAAGAAILLIGGAYSWVTTRSVTPRRSGGTRTKKGKN